MMSTAIAEPLRLASEDDLFTALIERDARADGRVFYTITSTGIYCRPVCPARKPLRKNVRFFLSTEAAERAGFRACKRCHPTSIVRDPAMDLIERACADIEAHLDGDCSLAGISARIGGSPHHLQRTFKALLGVSPKAYVDARRIELFKGVVRRGENVTTAIYEAGFGASSRLYGRSNAELGMTPGAYRDGGRGVAVSFAIAESALGWVIVAATELGVCAVRLGDDPAALQRAIAEEFHAAELGPDDPRLEQHLQTVIAFLAGDLPHLDLPVDVRATAFQRRVWDALRVIPRGETRTYHQVAVAIGNPAATRAVASACAANPVALVVPCHRVVRSDGGLGGYRWGLERKSALLRLEREGR